MAKKRKVSLVDAYNSAETREDQVEIENAIKARMRIWAIMTIFPVINWYSGAKLIYCRNTLRAMDGKEPGGFLNLLIAIWCWILPAFIGGKIIEGLGEKYQDRFVLGCGKVLDQYHYINE